MFACEETITPSGRPLFDWAGAQLPIQTIPEYLPTYNCMHYYLNDWHMSNNAVFQYEMAINDIFNDNVHGIVPIIRHSFLNCEIVEYFQSRALANMGFRLYDALGIDFIGELIQMSEREVFPYLLRNKKHLQTLRDELANDGLAMNSLTPGWERPVEKLTRLADPYDYDSFI